MKTQEEKRTALPIGSILTTYSPEDGNTHKYLVRSIKGYGGSGIVYEAIEVDDSDNEFGVNLCLKEYFPFRGFKRDSFSWNLVSDFPLNESDNLLHKFLECAEEEKKNSLKVKNKNGTIQVAPIRTLAYGKKLKIGGIESLFDDASSMVYTVMDDLGEAVSLSELYDVIIAANEDNSKFYNRNWLNAKGDRLSVFAVMQITSKVLYALQEIHDAGIVHGDIQPQNIFFSGVDIERDDLGTVVFLDFGSSKEIGSDGYTQRGICFSTSGYTAPEQRKSEALNQATDIYQVGKLIWYLLSGSINSTSKRSMYNDPLRLMDYGVMKEDCGLLCDIMTKATEEKQENRFCNAKELKKEINDLEKKYRPASGRLVYDKYDPSQDNNYFISRENEIDEIKKLLNQGCSPLFIWSEVRAVGKTTLVREYASTSDKSVYVIPFKGSMFATISDAPYEWTGMKPQNIEEIYEEKFSSFMKLSSADVVIIDGFYSENEEITVDTLKDRDYFAFISSCPARILFTTNYNMSKEKNNYEVTCFSEDVLAAKLSEKNEVVQFVDFKKIKKLISLLNNHTYLFSIVANMIDDVRVVDTLIENFENSDMHLSTKHVQHDKSVSFSNKDLSDILSELYNVSSLPGNYLRIIAIALSVIEDKMDYHLFCNSVFYATDPLEQKVEMPQKKNLEEWIKDVDVLCERCWLKKEMLYGKMYLVRPNSLLKDFVQQQVSREQQIPFIVDFVRGFSVALTFSNVSEVCVQIENYFSHFYKALTGVENESVHEKSTKKGNESINLILFKYVKSFFSFVSGEKKNALWRFREILKKQSVPSYIKSNALLGIDLCGEKESFVKDNDIEGDFDPISLLLNLEEAKKSLSEAAYSYVKAVYLLNKEYISSVVNKTGFDEKLLLEVAEKGIDLSFHHKDEFSDEKVLFAYMLFDSIAYAVSRNNKVESSLIESEIPEDASGEIKSEYKSFLTGMYEKDDNEKDYLDINKALKDELKELEDYFENCDSVENVYFNQAYCFILFRVIMGDLKKRDYLSALLGLNRVGDITVSSAFGDERFLSLFNLLLSATKDTFNECMRADCKQVIEEKISNFINVLNYAINAAFCRRLDVDWFEDTVCKLLSWVFYIEVNSKIEIGNGSKKVEDFLTIAQNPNNKVDIIKSYTYNYGPFDKDVMIEDDQYRVYMVQAEAWEKIERNICYEARQRLLTQEEKDVRKEANIKALSFWEKALDVYEKTEFFRDTTWRHIAKGWLDNSELTGDMLLAFVNLHKDTLFYRKSICQLYRKEIDGIINAMAIVGKDSLEFRPFVTELIEPASSFGDFRAVVFLYMEKAAKVFVNNGYYDEGKEMYDWLIQNLFDAPVGINAIPHENMLWYTKFLDHFGKGFISQERRFWECSFAYLNIFRRIYLNTNMMPVWIRAGETFYEKGKYDAACEYYEQMYHLLVGTELPSKGYETEVFLRLLNDLQEVHEALGNMHKAEIYRNMINHYFSNK